MESSFEGFVLDPSKCSKLSMDEKREIVYEISKSHGAPEMLQSWSRREILEILCAELGKERKYTGLTKLKLIEHLLKLVSKKLDNHNDGSDSESHPSSTNTQSSSKRQRKMDHPSRLPIEKNHFQCSNGSECLDTVIYCRNSACRATKRPEDAFCKRCSCCICFRYDDNKDPSLWLFCDSEPPNQGVSCGMSCHIECALKHEKAGIAEGGHCLKLDGSFYCASCGKVNDLLGCLKKQLTIAKGARRVDMLCHRIFLSHKLLHGTKKYQKLLEIVDTAMKKLEAEVGILDGLPIKMARGIVNRLSAGAEIQKLCTSAVDIIDSILSTALQRSSGGNIQVASMISPSIVSLIDVTSTTLTVVLSSESALLEGHVALWHRKASSADYAAGPTVTLIRPSKKFFISDLTPATEYMFKINYFGNTGEELGKCEVSFRTSSVKEEVTKSLTPAEGSSKGLQHASPKTNCTGVSNPSSEGDESNSPGNCSSYSEKTLMPSPGKVSELIHKEISHSENTGTGICCTTDGMEQEEMLGDSVSALDEERATGEVASEPNSTIPTESQRDSTNSTNENQAFDIPKAEKNSQSGAPLLEEISIDNETNTPVRNENEMEIVPFRCAESAPPITPCKLETTKDGSGWGGRTKSVSGEPPEKRPTKPEEPQAGSSSKKRSIGRCEDACSGGPLERNYEYCVKVIRWLECEGHIQKSFRVKFLTWFSLYATPQERRVVSVYVDTLIDDPPSLAGQLVDTFSEGICSKRPPPVPTGFCMKLWH